jgi:endonuclease/exonuclease/phosphatase family metal-dependent hydrolase
MTEVEKITVEKQKEVSIPKDKEFIVMSYNVSFGLCQLGERKDPKTFSKVITCIAESKADVVFLQETHDGYEYFTEKQLSDLYPFQYFHPPQNGWLASGIACLAKVELKVEIVKPTVDGSYFAGMVVTYGDIDIINVHLRPPLVMGHGSSLNWDGFKLYFWEAGIIHEHEVMALLKHKKCTKTIILGDFNEAKVHWTGKLGFHDAIEHATTWHWPLHLGLFLWGSYDHIYYNPQELNCIEYTVNKNYHLVSDHLPITATFTHK